MYNANQEEQKILEFWDRDKTFEKSVTERPENNRYVFYDGPPFATGLPHYGHIVASLMKDVVPRYFTMKGYRVERKWGWDCHGLPIENIIEKDLNLATKKDIEAYGVGNFNEACRATVLKYAAEWKKTIKRMGRWVDMENDYRTMDLPFMESVWWVFKQLWDHDYIYRGHKPMHICPRCVTPLSNFEVTQGYKDVKDISVIAKFKITEFPGMKFDEPVQILAWTTTPWTLPGNVLLAVGPDIQYDLVKVEAETKNQDIEETSERYSKMENYLIARDRIQEVLKDRSFMREATFKGSELVGIKYEPLFPYFKDTPGAFRVVDADFVSLEEGTGIVHIAPAYGEEDFAIGQREKLPLVQHVTMEGKFVPEVTDFAGMEVKPKDDPSKTDVEVLKWLAAGKKLFGKQKIEHSYPHCWRCDTPLLNFAATSWFVKVAEMKEKLLENNEKISWVPEHIKHGRFGKWLEGARDWAISRNRYWGTPLPVWLCEGEHGDQGITKKCENVKVFGSAEELASVTGAKIDDLHKHKIDGLTLKCEQCGGLMKRIPDVLDCWFESGSMPYGEMHYPFENKEKFEATFPAEFIAEGQDQTRGWFYTLHVLAAALTSGDRPAIKVSSNESGVPAFKNVIVNGIVLAEDGKKMSKKLKNYPDPEIVLEKFGADALRYYLVNSPVMEAESLNLSEAGVREMYNKVINTLYNVLEFYQMFAGQTEIKEVKSEHILDRWILSKLGSLVKEVAAGMESYKLNEASRGIVEFITELSQWYIRRSRDRFKGENEEDKGAALATLKEVLTTLSKVMAPFTPFFAEKVFQTVTGKETSVHLEKWPDAPQNVDEGVLKEMATVRKIVELGLALRAEAGIKVRQVLAEFNVFDTRLPVEAMAIIADELNVNKVMSGGVADPRWIIKEEGVLKVALDTEITEDLKKAGLVREIIRAINQKRKEMKLTINDRVMVGYETSTEILKEVFQSCAEEIKKDVLADSLGEEAGGDDFKIGEHSLKLKIVKK